MAGAEDVTIVIEESRDQMGRTLESFRKDLLRVRTGRASTALLDGVMVNYFDTRTPLNQLATLSVPDPRMIVVSPFDKSAIGDVERAIHNSNLGLTPSNDGKLIRIQVPPLTEERRKELVKQVHRSAEDHKVGVREARRDALSVLKDLESEGALSQDDKRREDKKIQGLTDDMVKELENIAELKEKEILQV